MLQFWNTAANVHGGGAISQRQRFHTLWYILEGELLDRIVVLDF